MLSSNNVHSEPLRLNDSSLAAKKNTREQYLIQHLIESNKRRERKHKPINIGQIALEQQERQFNSRAVVKIIFSSWVQTSYQGGN